MPRTTFAAPLFLFCMFGAAAADTNGEFVEALRQLNVPRMKSSAVGVTRRGTPILSLLTDDDLNLKTRKVRILLVGGLDGSRQSVESVVAALRLFYTDETARPWRQKYALSAVPCADPDRIAQTRGPSGAAGGPPTLGFPPEGSAYDAATNPQAVYLWRWIGMHAPDLVVDVRSGDSVRWFVPPPLEKSFEPKLEHVRHDSLARQLPRVAPCETGTIPAIEIHTAGDFLPKLISGLERANFAGPSAARRVLIGRLDRTPIQVAEQLSEHYGHDLKQVVYIPALALVGRIRLGKRTGDEQHLRDVTRIASPYFRGDKPTAPRSGSGLSGHLVFCELADHSSDRQRERYIQLARVAADLAFDDDGRPQPCMPFHNEMSDALFMGGPILARVGRLAGQPRYLDACVRHVEFMRKLVLRDDGLYRHSPLDEAAWGRGNGFPALGLAMCLADFPEEHAQRGVLLTAFQNHMRVLAKHQDPTGMWHQVIDRAESYRELSCTCMITFAMARGVRHGWLDRKQFEPVIQRAWYAIRTRVGPNGRLVDVCTGTGKQRSLRAYFDRPAILGSDARGGAMALLVATEMASFGAPP